MAPTPSGGTPRASARKRSRDSTTTATARATTRTRKLDRATACHEAGDAAGRVATRRLRPTSMSSRSAIEGAVSVWSSSPVTRLQSVARETHRQPSVDELHAIAPSLPPWRSACSTLADVAGCEHAPECELAYETASAGGVRRG